MSEPIHYYVAYHAEYAPTGRRFSREEHGPLPSLGEGWVDNPAKIGINLWGPSREAAVARVKAQFDRDGIQEDPPGRVPDAEEKRMQSLAEENRRLKEQLHQALRADGVDDDSGREEEILKDKRSAAGIDPDKGPLAQEPLNPATERQPSDLADMEKPPEDGDFSL